MTERSISQDLVGFSLVSTQGPGRPPCEPTCRLARRPAVLGAETGPTRPRDILRSVMESKSCPKAIPFVCIVSSPPGPRRFFAPSSMRKPWPSGCRPMASPARSTISRRRSAAHSGCRFRISHEDGPFVRRRISRDRAQRAYPLHRSVRRSQFPGIIEVTVTLKAVSCGTEINIEQANLPTVIPVEVLLSRLATVARSAGAAGGAGYPGIAVDERSRHEVAPPPALVGWVELLRNPSCFRARI